MGGEIKNPGRNLPLGLILGILLIIVTYLLANVVFLYALQMCIRDRASLIDKHELKCVPRNGIGRSCKVGKEQIVGLLLALETFAATPDAVREERLTLVAQSLLEALRLSLIHI